MDVLNVLSKVSVDNSIVEKEYRNHIPFGSPKYGLNDEIRIVIPEIDNYTLPCESSLVVEGKLRKESDENETSKTAFLISNPVAFMFSDIRYVMSGIEVDGVRLPGITSTMKGYFSMTANEERMIENAGWDIRHWKAPNVDTKGNFSISVPLKYLCGFFEDYKNIILNVTQELVLIRCNDDKDVIYNSDPNEGVKLIIDNIYWRMPHIKVNLKNELALTKLASKNTLIEMFFRGWEIHEYPELQETTQFAWSVKTAPQLETPRYIIIGFQTAKKGNIEKNMAHFDVISFTSFAVYLNGKRYPYESMKIDFDVNRISSLYETYASFQKSYYGYAEPEPILNLSNFKTNPLIGIDCTFQLENIHKSSVDIRIEFSTKNNMPKKTSAYCLVLHNKLYEYSPFNKIVQRKY